MNNKRMLGVIDATTFYEPLKDLIQHRTLAALPFGGRYRLIDFVLSSMVNSGISSVAVFPKHNYRSLMDHLGSGRNWDLNRKRDGLFFFPAPVLDMPEELIGSFHHFESHMSYFYRSTEEYALVANCYSVLNMDFKAILDRHIKNGCDITEVHQMGEPLEIYLLKKDLLIDLIENKDTTGYRSLKDVIDSGDARYTFCSYEYTGYAAQIDSIEKYFKSSMELLNQSKWHDLFRKDNPIFTKVKDEPPTNYKKGATVKNSMIANGCVIEGHVENSIISRSVKIGKGTIIKNCIIMQKSVIGENCQLDSVILDKDVKITDNTVLISEAYTNPIVIKKGVVQGELMQS
ncbi:glucose-1-phosphate adenylyltransferase [Peribacillus saganii]|uniref:Glucose-1-phosphate adenylyltransferase n=1 Tax=Peribacillus saganii TaxID=2303992 RepID=A0A372LCC8_9BACI|nr:sugar phosphate nucleotidyltransferase [Peribacillus saganii]RFU63639.1 glucose-1-phosphate adenylyltransferase [Peribacillus saganii]